MITFKDFSFFRIRRDPLDFLQPYFENHNATFHFFESGGTGEGCNVIHRGEHIIDRFVHVSISFT